MFYGGFCKVCEKKYSRRKTRRKKPQTLAVRISEMAGAMFFRFGMWTPLPSRHFCSNFGFNQIRNHGITKVCKSRLLSSSKYTHGVARRLLGPHQARSQGGFGGFGRTALLRKRSTISVKRSTILAKRSTILAKRSTNLVYKSKLSVAKVH